MKLNWLRRLVVLFILLPMLATISSEVRGKLRAGEPIKFDTSTTLPAGDSILVQPVRTMKFKDLSTGQLFMRCESWKKQAESAKAANPQYTAALLAKYQGCILVKLDKVTYFGQPSKTISPNDLSLLLAAQRYNSVVICDPTKYVPEIRMGNWTGFQQTIQNEESVIIVDPAKLYNLDNVKATMNTK